MSPSSRFLSPVVVLAGLAAVLYLGLRCLVWLHPEVGQLAELWGSARQEQERREVLRRQQDALADFGRCRRETMEGLLAGRCTLLEAAARFRDLDRRLPYFSWEFFRSAHPGNTDAERHCDEVIVYVAWNLTDRPDRGPVLGRLKAELEAARRSGSLRLPDPAPIPAHR